MGDLEGRNAIVTGGGSGIGAALVAALRARGAGVVAVDINEAGLAEVAAATGCSTQVVDVSSHSDNEKMAKAALAELGSVDLAFLNAGVLGRSVPEQAHPLDDLDTLAGRYRDVLSVNVDGVVYGTLAVSKVMADGAAIVATASVAGLIPWHPDPVYTVSKHGVVGWVRAISPALKRRGITINAICPGGVATPMTGRAGAADDPHTLNPEQVAGAMIETALEPASGRAVSVVAGREPLRVEHEFNTVAGFD